MPETPSWPTLEGRESELVAVDGPVSLAERRQGVVVVVTGPDGAGKSALIGTVAERCRLRGWRVIESVAHRDTAAYQAVADPLSHLLAGTPGEGMIRELRGEAPERPLPRNRPGRTEGGIHQRLARAMDQAATVPTLLVLDDVDVADAATQRLAGALAVRRGPRLWSLLMSARTPAGVSGAHVVSLGPLSEPVLTHVVRRHVAGLSPEQVAVAVARAEGNPLFAQEIAHALSTGTGAPPIPPSAFALVRDRLDALPTERRWILPLIVLAGRDASWPLLTSVAPDMLEGSPTLLGDSVARLVRGGLVEERGDRLTASHPLIGEASVAMLSRAQRALIHELVAIALTKIDPGAASQARHRIDAFEALPTPSRAQSATAAAARAAHRSLERADETRAVDLARCALRAYACCDPDDQADLRGAALDSHLVLGHALSLSAPRQAQAAYENGLASATVDDDRVRLLMAIGWLHYTHGEHTQAAQCYQRALALPGASPPFRAEPRADLGWIFARQGLYDRSLRLYHEALDILGDQDAPAVRGLLLDRRAMTLAFAGHLEEAARVAASAYEVATRADAPQLLAAIQAHRANICGRLGRWEPALRYVDDALELASGCGDTYVESVAWWACTDVLIRKGDRRGALEANGRELEALRLVGNPAHLAACKRRRQRLLDNEASLTISATGPTP